MERRTLIDDAPALVAESLEERGFLAVFTERTGGVSGGPYATLNLGVRTGDARDAVLENRSRVATALALERFATPEQVHGGRVVRVGPGRAAAGWDGGDPVPGADALAVTQRDLGVAVLTADCLPIALGSDREGLLVAVHAGWRGLAARVVQAAVARFERPAGVHAAIGPAIGPCHYEVGEDVALAVAAASDGGAVTRRGDGSLFLDLEGTAARTLRSLGVRRIDRAETCTACEEERFFSYRRDGETGRQALVAVRR